MLTNEDIYTGVVNPSTNINPKIVGAFYINTKTAKLFVCKDNTINKNVWEMCNPDVVIPEIPRKFKFSMDIAWYGYEIIKNNVWYPNNKDEIWFVVANTDNNISNWIIISKIEDESYYTAFENFYPASIIVPKGYQFKVTSANQSLQWVKVWL